MEVTKVIHQCETCSHHSSFLNIQGKQGEWQPICKADENPYRDGYCPRYDKYERSQKMIKNTQTNPMGGGHSREYTAYTQLTRIARQHGVTLQTMAIINDIQYCLTEENQQTLTQEEFQQLYDEILTIDQIYSYDDTVRTLLTHIQKQRCEE